MFKNCAIIFILLRFSRIDILFIMVEEVMLAKIMCHFCDLCVRCGLCFNNN